MDEMDFDAAIEGSCEDCGEDGRLMEDPYDADVNNRTTLVYLCDACAQEHVNDI